MMKSLATGLISFVLALWVVAIAAVSIQNIFITNVDGEQTLVALRFLGQTSVQLPFGIVLAISVATGMLIMSMAIVFTSSGNRNRTADAGRHVSSSRKRKSFWWSAKLLLVANANTFRTSFVEIPHADSMGYADMQHRSTSAYTSKVRIQVKRWLQVTGVPLV